MLQFYLILMLVKIAYGEWSVKILNNPSQNLFVNEKFSLSYINITHWNTTNKFSWYTQSTTCKVSNNNLPTTNVVCTYPGTFSFGIIHTSNIHQLLAHKRVVIRPSNYKYGWQAKKSVLSSSKYEVTIAVSLLKELGNTTNTESTTQWFYSKNFQPRVILLNKKLDGINEQLSVTYDTNISAWLVTVDLPNYGDSATLHILSANDVSLLAFQVKDTKVMLDRPKFDLAILPGNDLFYTLVVMNNKLISDPYSQHVGVLILDSMMMFSPDGFIYPPVIEQSENDLGFITNILFLPNHFVIISDGNVRLLRNGKPSYVKRDENFYWFDIYTCHHYPQGLQQTCDLLFLLNFYKFAGVLYMFNVTTEVTTKLQIPFCKNINKCYINHMEINMAFDLVRILYNDCSEDNVCAQAMTDYYFHNDRWFLVHTFDHSLITSFRFLPVYSLDMLLLTEKAVYLTAAMETSLKYSYINNEEFDMKDILTWNNKALVTFHSGWGVFFQYGGNQVYKIFIGKGMYPQIVNELLYSYYVTRDYFVKDIFPLQAELDAASSAQPPSVLRFTSNIHNKIYILDCLDELKVELILVAYLKYNHSLQISYDTSIGLNVDTTIADETSSYLMQRSYLCKVSFNASHLSPRSDYPRVSAVTFFPVHFNGYLTKHLKAKTLFFSAGCPPKRHLHVEVASKYEISCDRFDSRSYGVPLSSAMNIFHTQCICLEALIDEAVELKTKIFDDERLLQTALGVISISMLHGESTNVQFTSQTSDTNLVAGHAVGLYIIKLELQSNQSFCDLHSYLLLQVKAHYTDDRTVIIIVSICVSLTIMAAILAASFVAFKKQTAKEHEAEAECQKRQQQLRFLTSLQHYQDQMDIKATVASAGMARRSSSAARRSSSIIPEDDVNKIKTSHMTPLIEED